MKSLFNVLIRILGLNLPKTKTWHDTPSPATTSTTETELNGTTVLSVIIGLVGGVT